MRRARQRPGKRWVTSCSTQPLPSGSLNTACDWSLWPLGIPPWQPDARLLGVEPSGRAVEDVADRGAALDDLSSSGLDVVRDEQQSLLRSRGHRGDPGTEADGGARPRRGGLHDAEVVSGHTDR